MLNISSIKELLRKPLKIQRNITRNLPEKLKRKIFGLYFLANFLFFIFFFLGGGEGGRYFVGWGTNVELNGFL